MIEAHLALEQDLMIYIDLSETLKLSYYTSVQMKCAGDHWMSCKIPLHHPEKFLAPSEAQEMQMFFRSSDEKCFRAQNIHLSLSGQSQVSFGSKVFLSTS